MQYDRTVFGYHGCDVETAERLLRGEPFKPSINDFDWLGGGVYFWEYGADRALRFAEEQARRGKVNEPAIVGAIIQLGKCFDLLDTRFTADLAAAYVPFADNFRRLGLALPVNGGSAPDHKLRRRDCAVLNWYLDDAKLAGMTYDSVRAAFVEGGPVYEGSGIHQETHIQIAVRTPECIVGVFRPPTLQRSRGNSEARRGDSGHFPGAGSSSPPAPPA